ncbi:hypothetical protein AAHC03_04911 [Spirometra sp. Aus1]
MENVISHEASTKETKNCPQDENTEHPIHHSLQRKQIGEKDTHLRLENEKLKKTLHVHKREHYLSLQEKAKVKQELERIRKYNERFPSILRFAQEKYRAAVKEAVFCKIERDRAITYCENLRTAVAAMDGGRPSSAEVHPQEVSTNTTNQRRTGDILPEMPDSQRRPVSEFVKVRPSGYAKAYEVKIHGGHVYGISVNQKLPIVCSVGESAKWTLIAAGQGTVISSGPAQKTWLSSVAFHPGGEGFLTATADGILQFWSLQMNDQEIPDTRLRSLSQEHSGAVWSIDWHWAGHCFVTAGLDHLVRLCDPESMSMSRSPMELPKSACQMVLRGHTASVNSARFVPDGRILVTASADKSIGLWDTRTALCERRLNQHKSSVNYASFASDGTKIVSCDAGGCVYMWDLRQARKTVCPSTLIPVPLDHGVTTNQVQFDPVNRSIVTANSNGSLIVTECESFNFLRLYGHKESVTAIEFDRNSGDLFSASKDATVCMWA